LPDLSEPPTRELKERSLLAHGGPQLQTTRAGVLGIKDKASAQSEELADDMLYPHDVPVKPPSGVRANEIVNEF
jgi:hypothetical protein